MSRDTRKLPGYIRVDSKIRPQDDLYGYACSNWIRNNPRPTTWTTWGVADAVLCDKADKRLQGILRDWMGADPASLSNNQLKAISYYRNLLNRKRYKADSLKAIHKIRRQIYGIKDQDQAVAKARLLAISLVFGTKIFIDFDIDRDNDNICKNWLFITTVNGHGGQYLSDDQTSLEGRTAYLQYLHRHQALLAKLDLRYDLLPAKILEIEMTIKSFDWPIHKARDYRLLCNKFSQRELRQNFKFHWSAFFKELGVKMPSTVIVNQPDTLKKILAYIDTLSLDDIRAYLFFKVCSLYGEYLDDSIGDNYFNFFFKYIYGIEKPPSLAERSFLATNHAFADVLGRAYVEEYLPATHRRMVSGIAEGIRKAFITRLQNNTWLSEKSKHLAIAKLENIVINIGSSDYWRDYDAVQVTPGKIIETSLALNQDYLNQCFSLLSRKLNRRRFGQITENVQEVNACAHPHLLSIQCKAGCLQAPLFNPQVAPIYNVAAIGSLIAHELTHHFDETGWQFDKDGRLKSWLTKSERQAFRNKQRKLIQLAHQYQPVAGRYLCGKQVIGEIIADLGGLEIVLEMVKATMKPGLQRDQILRNTFIGYAYVYASDSTDEYKVQQGKTGIHPPYSFRVNEIVRHCPDFYRVFDVSPTDKLYLKDTDRVVIW